MIAKFDLWGHVSKAVKGNMSPLNGQFTSPIDNFHCYSHSNALFFFFLNVLFAHNMEVLSAAENQMSTNVKGMFYDFRFVTVYCRMFCRHFVRLSNKFGYICKLLILDRCLVSRM